MSCRSALLITSVLVGCTDDPQVVVLAAQANEEIDVAPAQSEAASADDVTYRWDLVVKPDTSEAADPEGRASIIFVPDVRGTYLIDRWMAYGLSERLTHEFVLQVGGVAPEAVVRGEPIVALGTATTLDASESRSLEGLTLRYQWRLAERPRDSAATLVDPTAVSTSFVPDVPGVYLVELAVFDGELWSEHTTLVVTAQ